MGKVIIVTAVCLSIVCITVLVAHQLQQPVIVNPPQQAGTLPGNNDAVHPSNYHQTDAPLDSVPSHTDVNLLPKVPERATSPVTAVRAAQYLPGSLICPDHDTAQLVAHLYAEHWEAELQNKVTRGQAELVHGKIPDEPHPYDFECALVPSGTPGLMEHGNFVPVVTAHLENGSTIRGVTLPGMFR